MTKKPFALIILDGWGYRRDSAHNPTRTVATPTIGRLFSDYPHLLIEASGVAVGLPEGQMGNSEVGHLHIGAGRKVPQDLVRINDDIKNGDFFKNPLLINAILKAKKNNSAVHVVGLVSDGGVHSHIDQLCALINLIHQQGIAKNYCHVICDGRDTPPKSALPFIERIEACYTKNKSGIVTTHPVEENVNFARFFVKNFKKLLDVPIKYACAFFKIFHKKSHQNRHFNQIQSKRHEQGMIASVIGRYHAMDRDKRWERTQKAYDLFTLGKCEATANSAENAVKQAYARGETDEFILPTMIENGQVINDGDVVIFMNFRADRARQLTHAFIDKNFTAFKREKIPQLSTFVTLTHYLDHSDLTVAYPPLSLKNTLGEFLSLQGLTQLRLAETEKYAHVTYFLNGGVETPFKNESRTLIPSPKIATYDTQPAMSAIAVTDAFVNAIESGQYDVIICNYANPDMIGHTGNIKAAEKAMVVIDDCLARVLTALKKANGEALITADHGNIEMMYDEKTGQPHTAHTTNLVPLIYVGRPSKCIAKTGALDDVAPTLLYLMGLEKPMEMTGKVLFEL